METIESAARLTTSAEALANTALGASLARVARPLSEGHERFADSLATMSRTADANADDYATTDAATGSALSVGDER